MSHASRERFRDLAARTPDRLDLACLLIAAEAQDPGIDLDAFLDSGLAQLDALAETVAPVGRDDDRLRDALAGFHGSPGDYELLGSSLLPQVLRRRRGLPILLSTVWTETARRAGIGAYGVALPGHFVVGIGDPATFRADLVDGMRVLVDPWSGGRLLPYDRARDLVERAGFAFRREFLAPARGVATVARILANIQAWAAHPLRASTRLWAIDLALELPDPSPRLLRDRGLALLDMGHGLLARRWLEEYADMVADASPAEAESARAQAQRARALLN